MSTPVSTPADHVVGRVEPRHRGSLTLTERVIEKIAAQAAAEVAAASGRSGVLRRGSDRDAHVRPKVGVDLSATSTDVDVAVGIAYPGSIRRAAQEIREHVTERVETLTGVDVRRVDIDVTFLTTGAPDRHQRALR